MPTATAQQSDNIPITGPFEANLPFAGRGDSNDDSYNGGEGIDDKVPHHFDQAGGLHETEALAAAERHYYNISRGFSSDSGYAQLVKSHLADNDQFDRLNPIRNQYIVLLNPETVSALDSAATESYERRGQDNNNTVRAMAAEAARDGGQVIRIYDNLNGYAVQAPDDPRFIERLRNDPRIAHIELDQRVYALNHLQSIPSGINRIDGELSNTRSGDGAGSVNVDVAVLDSGIDLTHPDLNVYRSKTFVSGTTSAKDDNGHGTFVAGIIGAKDDHTGVVGVAPGARLWAVKVLDRSGSGLVSDIIAGIDYIVQNAKEIDAANLSFGCECSSPALDSAINKAVSAGITFAVAAGNSAKNANSFSPANNPKVIAVSAIADSDGKCGAKGPATSFGADDGLASFSNYGAAVSIAAPGVGILSTSMNGGYAKMSGTSAAAPHVAGAAALYEAASPSSSPSQVKSGLIANAVKSSVTTCDGNGLGYFTGDKDSSREPLLYLKGMGPPGDGGSNPSPINSVPTADSKTMSTNTNTPIDITLSGNDPEKDPLTFSIIDLPKNGQLSSVVSDTVRYKPNTGFVGQDTFTYVARDNKGATSPGKATISLTVTQAASCETLVPTSATANGNDGNVPSNVLDNNLNTRWSNLGTGSWIQLDLGSKKSICSVDIAWYLGSQRQYNFVISVSDNGNTFTNKLTSTSSGSTTSPEKYTLPAGTEGRYLRITVNGNTVNNWASIAEVAVFGSAAASTSCTKQTPSSVTASGFISPNTPSNAIDNNLNTAWSNKGVGSWIQLDLGTTKNICSVDIAWYLGEARAFNFDISVSVSNTGTSFTKVYSDTSSKTTAALEKYTLPAGTDARFIRITVNGNDVTDYAAITEIVVFGSAAASTSCTKQTPSSVTASGFISPNTPSNAIDNNLNTAWSNKGVGSWIQLDLGTTKNICSVDIAWYLGEARAFNFDISVSVSNTGTSFTKVYSDTSSKTTAALEKYTLPAGTDARFIRITVNGNDVTDYAAITEIVVSGQSVSPTGGGDAGTNDKFGIKKIYASKSGGEQWFMNMPNPTNDPRFYSGGETLTKNTDGYSYKIKSTSARLQVYTSSGYHPDQIATLNQQQLAAKGYMQSPNDWKNVEITGYFKVNSYTSSTTNGAAHIELLSRGGTHTSSKPCEGTAYHSNLYQTGRSKFEKELEHIAGYASNNPEKPGATSTLQGRGWIGIKAVFYTSPIDGSVKVEQWIDDTTDNVISPGNGWHKLFEYKDTGNNWSAPQNNCGGTLSQIISWGGPTTFIRWDNIDDMDIKDLSVREITPP